MTRGTNASRCRPATGRRSLQGVTHVAGLLDADAAGAERRAYLTEVRVRESGSEWNETGFFLLNIDNACSMPRS
jgi:hypothetical protein